MPPIVTEAADIIFSGGFIRTMNPLQPEAEALAVKDGTILAVGSEAELRAYQGPNTRLVELAGRALLPGFIDAHTHLFNDHDSFGTTLLGAQDLAFSNGITTLGNMYADEGFLNEMQVLAESGALLVRTNLYLTVTTNCGERTSDWWRAYLPDRTPGSKLWIGGLKVFADGGSCRKVAGTRELLPGYGLGDLFFTQDEMTAFLQEAQSAGYPLAIHAQGDRAIEQALAAFASVLNGQPNDLRHRIEHNSLVRPEMRSLYSEYDVVATLFGYHDVCEMPAWTDFYIEVGEDLRAMLDANPNAHFAWHGDDPSLPPISPLLDLASTVTRQDQREDGTLCDPPEWLRAKAINVEEGLRLMTTGSAYALFREEEVGSLEVGKFADMVILSADPTQVEPVELWEISLQATLVDGTVVYCAPGSEALCVQSKLPGSEAIESTIVGDVTASASASLPGSHPRDVLDGNHNGTSWVSGDYAPQWIEIDLGSVRHATGLKLWVDQDPSGFTRHRILGGERPDPTVELVRIEAETSWGKLLQVEGDWMVRFLRIETLESPSWVAWLEIEVITD
jgi:predicted amidohydrolase YtcJ